MYCPKDHVVAIGGTQLRRRACTTVNRPVDFKQLASASARDDSCSLESTYCEVWGFRFLALDFVVVFNIAPHNPTFVK